MDLIAPPESVPPGDSAVAGAAMRVPRGGRAWPAGRASSPCTGCFESNKRFDRSSPSWTYRIGRGCRHGVPEADGLLAAVNGCPSDGDVMAELGMAIGWKKPAFPLRGDLQRWAESVGCPLNPTVFTGLPTSGWESRCYTLIDEPLDPDTALVRWLGGS